MVIRPVACLLLVASVAMGAQQPQPKPLSKEQVVALVRDGFADESGVTILKNRGLDFVPVPEFLQSLRKACASEAFMIALALPIHFVERSTCRSRYRGRCELPAQFVAGGKEFDDVALP